MARAEQLQPSLKRLLGGVGLTPVLVIFFREGLESSLIVSIILAYLKQGGHHRLTRQVWAGVLAAVAVDLGLGLGLYHIIRHYDGSRIQIMLEGTTYFVAMAMLTGMSFWMKSQSRDIKRAVENRVKVAVSRGSMWAMVGLTFITVSREGLETVFFTLAVALRSNPLALLAGAVIGLGLALAVVWAMLKAGRRVRLSLFFNVLGGVLLVFAAALLADGIEDFQVLGWLPIRHVLWHTGNIVNQNGVLGDILHNFTGYAAAPTVLQLVAYVLYLVVGFWRYFSPRFLIKRGSPAKSPVR